MPNICESLFIEIHCKNRNIIIGTIYRPNTPPKADIDVFIYTMQELQQHLNDQHLDTFILGDINIDLLSYNKHNRTNEYLDGIFSAGFIPLITKPTRITPHSATLIDHIYTNRKPLATTSGILITDISDHLGIFTILNKYNLKYKQINKSTCFRRSFSANNIQYFNNLLQATNLDVVLGDNCPESSYNTFMKLYKDLFNIAFPIKTLNNIKKYKRQRALG